GRAVRPVGDPRTDLLRGAVRLDRVRRRAASDARTPHPHHLHPDGHQHGGGDAGGVAQESGGAGRLRRAGRAALFARLALALLDRAGVAQPRPRPRQGASQEVRGGAWAQGLCVMIGLAAALLAAAGLRYEVVASAGASELSIEARIPAFPDRDGELSVDDGAEPFIRDVMLLSAEGAVRLERSGDSWFAPGCAAHGCRIRYRFALREAATVSGDEDLGVLYGETVESPPGAWLLRPLRVPA